jgi:predicted DNA-binding WGR domain protein
MSDFKPCTISKQSRNHKGGTKDYHIVTIAAVDGSYGILITRFAKKNAWGQMQVQTFYSTSAMAVAANAKRKEKFDREYTRSIGETGSVYECRTFDDVKKALGPAYWSKLTRAVIDIIGGDSSIVREQPLTDDWTRDKDGKLVRAEQPLRTVEVAKPTVEDKIKQNANWGLW